MNPRAEVLLWAHRIIGKLGAAPHVLLEVSSEAEIADITAAFHRIARIAHPDLHRTTLSPEELDTVTTAYSRVTAAYQELRSQRTKTAKMRPIRDDLDPQTIRGVAPAKSTATGGAPATTTRSMPAITKPRTETQKMPALERPSDPAVALPESGKPAGAAATMMSSKALVHYRKAELCLRRGALREASLQLKMAIAADPVSEFLRNALAEVEAEVRKNP